MMPKYVEKVCELLCLLAFSFNFVQCMCGCYFALSLPFFLIMNCICVVQFNLFSFLTFDNVF